MKLLITVFGIGYAVCAAAGQGQTPPPTSDARSALVASAKLIDAQGRSVGEARFQQTPHGVLIKLDLENVAPGTHGLHIHDVGRCDPPSFESAGGHFNSSGRQHGFMNQRGPHTGDLPNIEVPTTAQISVEYYVPDVTLAPGAKSLLDSNGSAIVIHAGKDDYAADPAGGSGDRLACGQISRPDTTR